MLQIVEQSTSFSCLNRGTLRRHQNVPLATNVAKRSTPNY
jgi:hypothetical protein